MSDLNIKEHANTVLAMRQDDDIDDDEAFYMLYNAIQNQTKDEAAKEFCCRFDNPLEALGVVMRETGVSAVACEGASLSFDKGYDELHSKPFGESDIIEVFGQDILNTLKEGK